MVVHAGYEGIPALDPVHEALLTQKVERAIDRNRRRPLTAHGQAVDDLVGSERMMAREQRLQDPATYRCQPFLARGADRLGMSDGIVRAAPMIVVGPGKYRVRG